MYGRSVWGYYIILAWGEKNPAFYWASFSIVYIWSSISKWHSSVNFHDRIFLQVNLCQKLFFLQNMGKTCCVQKMFWMSETNNNFCTQHVLPRFELGIFMYWTCNSMNNLLSYCGLVDAKIRASDKDLPVKSRFKKVHFPNS